MRVTPTAATVPFLVVLLTWLSLGAVNPNAELFDHALAELDRFETRENALYSDVFTARAGILRNYDPLVRDVNELCESRNRLRATAAIDSQTAHAVDQLVASIGRQEELVENFKSNNALLHNSLSYFGRFSTRPVSPDLGPAVSSAAAAMLHLTLETSPAAAREVEERLDELGKQARSPGDSETVEAMLAHGRLLHDLLPAVDGTLKAMRAEPRGHDQDVLRSMLLARQATSRTHARQFRGLLYGVSLLLVGFLVHLGLRLRARANALRRRAAFEHVIAGISMRFINAQPHNIDAEIDRALADMAECIGCDRAYFVLSGPEPRLHFWCKPGIKPPRNWPDHVPEFAARFEPTVDGVIHIPRVDRMTPGENKDACVALGFGGWACVTNVDDVGTTVALGFEAIGRPCQISALGELSLLRMALDTIVYAVGRQSMEQERARLETQLQQARRLEKVGTFTSGIAHNFNNILGGILGHSEVIEERLGSDARLLPNLSAIRRGAERARDLVDQILVFGRRRDARHQPMSVGALIAEAELLLNASLPVGIDLSIREPPPTALVSAEPGQLQQVIFNLCNNAAQAMENVGRIELEVEVHEVTLARSLTHGELPLGRHVCIAVQDAGRGMDAATLARIFEPFFTTRMEGNGLGLATVHEIVREHDGVMNVKSAPGKGTCFEVWLPCLGISGSAEAPILQLGCGETVLMVASDSSRLLRDEEMVAALGYEPVGFTGADVAMAACQAAPRRFDTLVVGDLGSTISSLELAAALHTVAPHLPIVLATKSTEEIGADALVGAGIADVVRWPIVAEEIAAALNHCSEMKQLEARAPRATHFPRY
jgi:signal transduction histidine kinase